MRIGLWALVGLLAACNGDDSGMASSGGGTGSGGDNAEDGPGMDSAADGPSNVDLQHGTVKVEFHRGAGVSDDPFVGTSVIAVRLDYAICLTDFYDANPNWTMSGPDGAPVFGTYDEGGEGWKDRLCSLGNVDCEVLSFLQSLDNGAGHFLQVTYAVTGAIENRTLHFGPLPLASLADCGDTPPTVRITSDTAARGLDGLLPDGTPLWRVQAFNPGEAATDQGASISIDVVPEE